MLVIKSLHVSIADKEILKGLDLTIKPGEIHVLLGPNGSGKSSLAMTLAGHPEYKVTSDERQVTIKKTNKKPVTCYLLPVTQNYFFKIELDDEDIVNLTPDQRVKRGLFIAFQNPVSLDGVNIMHFLRTIHKELYPTDEMALFEFRQLVEKEAKLLGLNVDLLQRNVNEGFSGGERKRLEMLQLRLLKPKYAVIDEIDSGLDIDGQKNIAKAIKLSVAEFKMGVLLITHQQKLLKYLNPDWVHVMVGGEIVASGKKEILEKIEQNGYKKYQVSSIKYQV